MRPLLLIIFALFFAARPVEATIDITLQMQLGNPSNATVRHQQP